MAREAAAKMGCAACEEGLTIAGTPVGTPEHIRTFVAKRVTATQACIDALEQSQLTAQEGYLLLQGSIQRREEHLRRVVPWDLLQDPIRDVERAVQGAYQRLVGLSEEEVGALQAQQMHLPHRHGGTGLVRYTPAGADAAYLAAAALCEQAMAAGPASQRPFANAGAQGLWDRWDRVREAFPALWPRRDDARACAGDRPAGRAAGGQPGGSSAGA